MSRSHELPPSGGSDYWHTKTLPARVLASLQLQTTHRLRESGLAADTYEQARRAFGALLTLPGVDAVQPVVYRKIVGDREVGGGIQHMVLSTEELAGMGMVLTQYGLRVPVYELDDMEVMSAWPYDRDNAEMVAALGDDVVNGCAEAGIWLDPDLTTIQGIASSVMVLEVSRPRL